MVVNQVPVVFGSGRPFFGTGHLAEPLRLENPRGAVLRAAAGHCVGALLAVFIGLAPAAVWTLATGHLRPRVPIPVGPSPFAVPWTLLAVLTLGIPALAAAATSLLGRSPAPLTARRGGQPQWPTASH